MNFINMFVNRTPDAPAPSGPDEERLPLPEDLQCPLCDDLIKDAVLAPCCAIAFCDECELPQRCDDQNSYVTCMRVLAT